MCVCGLVVLLYGVVYLALVFWVCCAPLMSDDFSMFPKAFCSAALYVVCMVVWKGWLSYGDLLFAIGLVWEKILYYTNNSL